MSDLIERAKAFIREENPCYCAEVERDSPEVLYWMTDFAQSERTRIAAELEALSQKTPPDAMVTALLDYADKLRKND